MIKYNPKNWFSHIFKFHKSDTVYQLWKELLFIGILTFGFVYVELHYFKHMEFLSNLMAVYSLIGFVLSLLLVFRTNSAYDRWWEGRKKWGELVNTTRNLSIRIAAMDAPADVKDFFARMIPNYAI